MDEIEEWREVVGYEGYYSVSNYGTVRQDKQRNGTYAGRVLKPKTDRYYSVKLIVDKIGNWHTVHSLVARAFIGPRPEGLHINHKDGNRYNNYFENLEYITCIENIRHSHRLGISARGERVHLAKLTEKEVIEIRSKHKRGINHLNKGYSYSMICKEYRIHKTCVANIVHRRTWKHI